MTGVAFGDITGYYYRSGAGAIVELAALKTMTLGTWATEGFIEVDASNMPGYYQLGLPDAALLTGADQVNIMLKGAVNMAPLPIEIQLTDKVADLVWDEILTGATHNINNSAGKRLRQAVSVLVLDDGTLQSATVSTAVLDNANSSLDDFYKHAFIVIDGGTGVGQARLIESYIGAARTASIIHDWVTVPDDTSTYEIVSFGMVHAHELDVLSAEAIDSIWDEVLSGHTVNNSAGKVLRNLKESSILAEGTLAAAGSFSATLNGSASALDNFYKHTYIAIVGGTGAGQTRMIESYVGSTKIATLVAEDWVVEPDDSSDYIIYQYAVGDSYETYNVEDKTGYSLSPAGIDGVWDETFSEPSPGAPPATTSFRVWFGWLWAHFRNKGTMNKTTGEATIYNDAGSAIAKGTDTDDDTTFTKGELGAP